MFPLHSQLSTTTKTNQDERTSDLYPYLSNSSLTATSQPASTLYNKNAVGSKYMHLDIKNIAIDCEATDLIYRNGWYFRQQ